MNCLLLGGTGFIGQKIAAQRPEWRWTIVGKQDADLSKETEITKLIGSYDIVINCAGFYGGLPFNTYNKDIIYSKNFNINNNVCKLVALIQPKKFVQISSACVYPDHGSYKLFEKDITGESFHPSVIESGRAKYHMLELLKASNIKYEYLVISNVYGPNEHLDYEKSHFIGALANKIYQATEKVQLMGTGSAVRDFVFVTDMAEAVCKYCELESSTCLPTNISTGQGHNIKQIAELLIKQSKKDLQVEWGSSDQNGTPVKILDNTKMLSDIGYVPETDIITGLKRLWEWIQNK